MQFSVNVNFLLITRVIISLFCVVPNFCISPDVAGLTDEEMQRKAVNNKKHNSFSSYCKNLVGLKDKRNNKSVDSEVRNIARMCFSTMHCTIILKLQYKYNKLCDKF